MTQIDANAVIEAYQERLKILTHELMLAQAYIAAQSTQISEYQDAVSEKDARIIGLENELGDAHDRLIDGVDVVATPVPVTSTGEIRDEDAAVRVGRVPGEPR